MECFGFLVVMGVALFALVKVVGSISEIAKLRADVSRLEGDVNALRRYASMLRDLVESYARQAAGQAATPPPADTEVSPVASEEAPAASPEPETPDVATPIEVPPSIVSPDEVPPVSTWEDDDSAPEPVVSPMAAKEDVRQPEPEAGPAAPADLPDAGFDKRSSWDNWVDWENIVGIKLFSAVAGIALVLAAVFFLKYSVERGWLVPEIRAAIGLLAGTSLIVVCELRVARGYHVTANAMHGAGIAILYATLFAMYSVWHLVPAAVAFGLMLLVTAVAVALSIRRESVFIAILGMLGGFATPALLSTGENAPITLFSYLMLLNVGLSWVAFRKRWPALTFGSLVLTAIYQWAWVGKFLDAAQLPLAAGIFFVFAGAGSAALWSHRSDAERHGSDRFFRRVALTSVVLPIAFALFVAAVPAYGLRFNVLFGFLLLVTGGLVVVALRLGFEWLHTVAAAAAVVTFALWSLASYSDRAWPLLLGWLAAFVALFLFVATRREWIGNLAAPALFFLFPLLTVIEPRTASPLILFTSLLVLLSLTAVVTIVWNRKLLYPVAAAFTIVTEGAWAARHLVPERLIEGVVVFGVLGIFMLAVPTIARYFERPLQPRLAPALTAIASLLLLFFLAGSGVAQSSLWGLAIILGLLLIGTIRESRAIAEPMVAIFAIALSWMILAVWWANAPVKESLIQALIVVLALALIVLIDAVRSGTPDSEDVTANGAFLALFAHAFLFYVASRPALGMPPWPLFAILALVDLAAGAAALVLRRPLMLLITTIATEVILFAWTDQVKSSRWAVVALVATLLVAVWTLVWRLIGRRFSIAFKHSVYVALLGGHVVAILAGVRGEEPILPALLATHLLLAVTTLVVAWKSHDFEVAPVSAMLTAFAIALAPTGDAGLAWRFWFATAIYVLYLAYPLLLGHRLGRSVFPHVGAVLASAAYFFAVRDVMMDGGYGWMIGVLPVAQAIAMMLILVRLLAVERRDHRQLTRLALVAATALAFITVAVPLQLERQWVTVAWALEGAALFWLFRKIPHRGLLAWGSVLLATSFVRLAFNPLVLAYYPSSVPIWNWYLYAYLITAACFFAAAWYMPDDVPRGRPIAAAAGTFLLFALLNIEIADFYAPRGAGAIDFMSTSLAQDLTYTIGWGVFAIALLVAGIALATRAARIAALALLVITIFKCFLHDLGNLDGLYRVASLVALAFCLVAVGVLIQKFVVSRASRAEAAA